MAADIVTGIRVVSFLLGGAVIVDAVLSSHPSTAQWITGLVLVGIIPPEAVADRFRRRRRNDGDG